MEDKYDEYSLNDSKISDLDDLVECHKQAFPKTISIKLGNPFLHKMIEWYLLSDRGFMFHVNDGDKIIGYCGGIKTLKAGLQGAASSITQYAFNVFVISYLKKPWLLLHPDNWVKYPLIVRNIINRFTKNKKKSNLKIDSFTPFWGLTVIGVIPNYHGKGIGSLLIKEFEKKAKYQKIKLITLSVESDNIKAIRAYNNNGWEEKNRKKKSITMVKNI